MIDIPSHRDRGEEDVVPALEHDEDAEPQADPSPSRMADALAEAQIEVGAGSKTSEAAEEAADRESVE